MDIALEMNPFVKSQRAPTPHLYLYQASDNSSRQVTPLCGHLAGYNIVFWQEAANTGLNRSISKDLKSQAGSSFMQGGSAGGTKDGDITKKDGKNQCKWGLLNGELKLQGRRHSGVRCI